MNRARRVGVVFVGLAALGSCAPAVRNDGDVAGTLTPEQLARAAEAAGFRVRHVKADLPSAARSGLAFTTIDYDSPRLTKLRDKFALERVVSEARDEWTAQLLLKEWVHKAIPGGNPKVSATGANEILDYAARGETFYCTHYAITYVECALALGWQARKVAVDRKHGPEGLESTHHGVAEVWSNMFRKWVVIDPQSNLHFEKKGAPLSSWEIRAEWLRDGGAAVDHVVGVPPRAARKNPAIVWWNRPGEDETSAYFWIYIVDHAIAEGNSGARFILPQDRENAGLIWYQNDSASRNSRVHVAYQRELFLPTARIEDAYWTVGVVEGRVLRVSKGSIELSLDAYWPGRVGFEASFDGKGWEAVRDPRTLRWNLKPGVNGLRLRGVGRREVRGPQMTVLLTLE